MNQVYLIDGVRTPIGSFCGSLQNVSATELGRTVIAALLERTGLPAQAVDEVILGNVLSAGLGQNVARQAALAAGIPKERTALTVNMVCGSGLRAVSLAAQSIALGDAEVVVAGGTENMSAAPYLLLKARSGYRMGHGELLDSVICDGLWDVFNNYHMGVSAEELAAKFGISRAEQDAFAARSQNRAEKAIAEGRFKDEIVPVVIPQKKGAPVVFAQDEFPRKGVTPESIGHLKPAFKPDGTVTAANSSGINDGAAAVLVAGEAAVKKHSLKPMARVVSYACAGVAPAMMGIGPVEATGKALAKAGWKLGDVDLIESNEAFAVQALAVGRELGWDDARVNVNGGAIALGHPIGVSGTRILATLIHEMKRRGARRGLAMLCIGGGMGIAMCVELVVRPLPSPPRGERGSGLPSPPRGGGPT